jgi:hypothetical protein
MRRGSVQFVTNGLLAQRSHCPPFEFGPFLPAASRGRAQGETKMKTSLLLSSAFLGVTMLSAAPVLAQDAPTGSSTGSSTTVVQSPAPAPAAAPVVVQQPAAAAPAPSTVVVNSSAQGGDTSPRAYPGLIWGGVALWGVSYGAAAIGAAVADDACNASSSLCVSGRGVLYIPVVGPFIAMSGVNGVGSATGKTMLALDGAFQLGGVAMAITGIALSASAADHAPRATAKRGFMITPMASPTSAGLGAVGRF